MPEPVRGNRFIAKYSISISLGLLQQQLLTREYAITALIVYDPQPLAHLATLLAFCPVRNSRVVEGSTW
jgi:hypothetical protein